MKPLSITLATPRDRKKIYLTGLSLITVALLMIMLGFNYREYLSVKTENLSIEDGIARLQQGTRAGGKRAVKGRAPSDSELKKTADRTAFINTLIAKDIFPWIAALDMLERAVPDNVRLESFSPEKGTDETILKGIAESVEGLTVFMEKLEKQGLFKGNLLNTLGVSADEEDGSPLIRFVMNGRLNIEEILKMGSLGSDDVYPEAFR